MAGGLIPFDGEIQIGMINLKKRPAEYRRLVSYAEAEPLFPGYISGLDLVHFYNSVRKADKKLSNQLIEQIGIGSFYKNPIGTYSPAVWLKNFPLYWLSLAKVILSFLMNPW